MSASADLGGSPSETEGSEAHEATMSVSADVRRKCGHVTVIPLC